MSKAKYERQFEKTRQNKLRRIRKERLKQAKKGHIYPKQPNEV